VKSDIRRQTVNGLGIRNISRCLGISTDTVISGLKKEEVISNVNTEYLQARKRRKIRIEMDEM
jgi:hypothetical protein